MSIAFDSTTNGGYDASASSKTFSHTCSGTNRILFVGLYRGSTDNVTGLTYAGVGMTLIGKAQVPGGQNWTYLYYLVNPSNGTNNIVMSSSSSSELGIGAVSYTGAMQTGQPDAFTTNTGTLPASFTTTITTVANNCWTIGFWRNYDDDGNLLTISPGVFRQNAITGYYSMGDSNGPVTNGTNSLTVTNDSPYGYVACVMASFSPSEVTSKTNPAFLLNFL